MKHQVEVGVKLLELQREYRDYLKEIDLNSQVEIQKLNYIAEKIDLLKWVLNIK